MLSITTPAQLHEWTTFLEDGLTEVHKLELPMHEVTYTEWLEQRKQKEWVEDRAIVSGLGIMTERPPGDAFMADKPIPSDPKRFTMVPYGMAFVAVFELLEWERYSIFSEITKLMARSGVYTKNLIAWEILNQSFSTTDSRYTIYNGEVLCHAAHVLLRTGTNKNTPATPIALDWLGIQEGMIDFQLLKNEDNLFVQIKPKSILCHTNNQWVAETITKTPHRPDNANQAYNNLRGIPIISSPFVANVNHWWLVSDKRTLAQHAMVASMGKDLMLRRDYQPSTWNSIFTQYMSMTVQVWHYLGLWGSTGV